MRGVDQDLLEACRRGTVEDVRRCIEKGADVQVTTTEGRAKGYTPVHLALQYQSGDAAIECLKILLQSGAKVDATSNTGYTPLHLALEHKSGDAAIECLKILLQSGAKVDATTKYGFTPLHLALIYESGDAAIECLKILLQSGAKVDATSHTGYTPLHLALQYQSGDSAIECLTILLQSGAKVDATTNKGFTPLLTALRHQSGDATIACLKILLQSGTKVNATTKDGVTPLHSTLRYQCGNAAIECLKILLQSGAKVDATMNDGNTPLHYLMHQSGDAATTCLNILLQSGVKVDATTNDGETPLHIICRRYGDSVEQDPYDLIVSLIRAGGDPTVKDKFGKSALMEFRRDSPEQKRIQMYYKSYKLQTKLMSEGARKVDVVKVFLCGDGAVGKTTLKNSLTKKLGILSRLRLRRGITTKKKEKEEDYVKTPGINVGKQSVKGAGEFLLWDCAGQVEYAITHGMFLGVGQAIFIVAFDLHDLQMCALNEMPIVTYWLPFIKATRERTNNKPRVVLVGTHLDEINDESTGKRLAQRLLQHAKSKFSDYLGIDDTLILVDARDENSEGMNALKKTMKKHRLEITGTDTIPKLCDDIQTLITPLREKTVPVIFWKEFLGIVKEKYLGMDDRALMSVTNYLHIMGEVYLAEFSEKENQLVLDTRWLTTDVIGPAFAGKEFAAQMQTLPDQPCYTLDQIRCIFPEQIDVQQLLALLEHMDLAHEMADGKFLLPGKLPVEGPAIEWGVKDAYDAKGISFECSEEVDIFNPNLFPCVQKKILDSNKDSSAVSRTAIKFVKSSTKLVVELTKHKRAINIAVACHGKESIEASYQSLQQVRDMIQQELYDRSPGTNILTKYISHHALKTTKSLAMATTYSKENLMKAEAEDGFIVHQGNMEKVTDVLFKGYDTLMLREFGSECRYEWLPIDVVKRCLKQLDRMDNCLEDYRFLGKALGMVSEEIDEIAEESRRGGVSTSDSIIQRWCQDNQRKMTIGMLHSLLNQLSLVTKVDALKAVEEVMQRNDEFTEEKAIESETSSIDTGFSENLVRWRLVLRRLWGLLERDMDPSMVTSHLLYLPQNDLLIFEATEVKDVEKRIKNANTLLLFLLQRDQDDWPQDLIDGLLESKQDPFVEELRKDYQKVVQERTTKKQQSRGSSCDVHASLSEGIGAASNEAFGHMPTTSGSGTQHDD